MLRSSQSYEIYRQLSKMTDEEIEDKTLVGSAAGDVIYAADDNQVIYGGAGNDRLVGGLGHDFLLGGSGHDTVMLDYAMDSYTFYGDENAFMAFHEASSEQDVMTGIEALQFGWHYHSTEVSTLVFEPMSDLPLA